MIVRRVVVPRHDADPRLKPGATDLVRDLCAVRAAVYESSGISTMFWVHFESALIVRNAGLRSEVPGFCRPLERARLGMGCVVVPRLKPGATVLERDSGAADLARDSGAVRDASDPSFVAATYCVRCERALSVRNADVRSVAPGFSRGFRGFRGLSRPDQRSEPASAGDRQQAMKPGVTDLARDSRAVREACAAAANATMFRAHFESALTVRKWCARSVAPGFSRRFRGFRGFQ